MIVVHSGWAPAHAALMRPALCLSNCFVELPEVPLEQFCRLDRVNLPREDEVHERTFDQDVAEEASYHAEEEVKGQKVEHSVVRQE